MQPPPGSRRPPILLTPSTQQWLNRVAEKHRQFTSLHLSPEQRATIDRWLEVTFVYSTLILEGLEITESEAARAVDAPRVEPTRMSEADGRINEVLDGLRFVAGLTQSEGRQATLTPDVILRLRGSAGFRTTPGDARRPLKPTAPERLSISIENACRWFTAESFVELNPVEQASIAHLRLIEIQPFEEANERVALLAASLFTLRSGLPPIIITPDLAGAYSEAIRELSRGNTQSMVETVGTAVERALSHMIRVAA